MSSCPFTLIIAGVFRVERVVFGAYWRKSKFLFFTMVPIPVSVFFAHFQALLFDACGPLRLSVEALLSLMICWSILLGNFLFSRLFL